MKKNTFIALSIILLASSSNSILSMRRSASNPLCISAHKKTGIQKIITRSLIIAREMPYDGTLATLLRNRIIELGIVPDSIIGTKYNVLECYPQRYIDRITNKGAPEEEVLAYATKRKFEIIQQNCPNILLLKPAAPFNQSYAWVEKNYLHVNSLLEGRIEEDKAWIDTLNENITTYIKLCKAVKSSQLNGTLARWARMNSRNDFSLCSHLNRTWWIDNINEIQVKSGAIHPETLDHLLAFKEALSILESNFNSTVAQALKAADGKKHD
jgi:hypothetical protein